MKIKTNFEWSCRHMICCLQTSMAHNYCYDSEKHSTGSTMCVWTVNVNKSASHNVNSHFQWACSRAIVLSVFRYLISLELYGCRIFLLKYYIRLMLALWVQMFQKKDIKYILANVEIITEIFLRIWYFENRRFSYF